VDRPNPGRAGHCSAELVDCVIRNNEEGGLRVYMGTATLRGGTISENKGFGVAAIVGANVTVAIAEEGGLPQTVSKDNTEHDWFANSGAPDLAIIGIPQEKINVDDD